MFKIFVIVFACCLSCAELLNIKYPGDIVASGYKFINYNVESADGYMLGVHHFHQPKKVQAAVLLIHGVTQTGRSFFENDGGYKNSLPWMFLEKGYDVFLFNSRGNEYSRNHTYLDQNSAKYWSYDWTDVALYDLSKTIDVAIEKAKVKQIRVVCYSLGCSELFVLLSEWNNYNQYISEIHAMAPAVFLRVFPKEFSDAYHLRYLKMIASYIDIIGDMEANNIVQLGWKELCRGKPADCVGNFFQFLEYLTPEFYSQFEFYLKASSSGLSLRILTHFYQISISKKFRKYDFGLLRNSLVYNQAEPPAYQTKNITSNLYVYNAVDDELLDSNYFTEFNRIFGNLKKNFVVSNGFKHRSFMLDKRAKQFIYSKIVV